VRTLKVEWKKHQMEQKLPRLEFSAQEEEVKAPNVLPELSCCICERSERSQEEVRQREQKRLWEVVWE
jgi:hypothetical protein